MRADCPVLLTKLVVLGLLVHLKTADEALRGIVEQSPLRLRTNLALLSGAYPKPLLILLLDY
jgi:hypothetical protein